MGEAGSGRNNDQVVPTSWILSSQEETSLAAALREALMSW